MSFLLIWGAQPSGPMSDPSFTKIGHCQGRQGAAKANDLLREM